MTHIGYLSKMANEMLWHSASVTLVFIYNPVHWEHDAVTSVLFKDLFHSFYLLQRLFI